MATLTVSKFSCIDFAKIELGALTVLVGPQASGKSVLSKLIYFANDAINRHYSSIEDKNTFAEFTRSLEQSFLKIFPPPAWRKGKFEIEFAAGPYQMNVSGFKQSGASKTPRAKVKIHFSEYFVKHYESLLGTWEAQSASKAERGGRPIPSFERFWQISADDRKTFRSELGQHYPGYQMFIPAGRSYFTSMGKAVAVFEHSGVLDPITVQFGRVFAALRDHRGFGFYVDVDEKSEDTSRRKHLMQQFFGGSIEFGRDEEFVRTPDGRTIPFSVLSSGQQELLPLWLVMENMFDRGDGASLFFIEEPEAHLFPSSQADITNYLASRTASEGASQKILITTHSPYVLAQINNILKAGTLGARLPTRARSEINRIIPKASWLSPERVRAYALKSGRSHSICNDGLIDADYLDEVSGEIAAEFSALLEIENHKWL